METSPARRTSLLRLFRALTTDSKTFIRQEIQLAKTEIGEKISEFGRNAAILAIGGFVAYAGLIVLLVGLGWLLAWLFQLAGLSPFFAAFLGLGIIGVLVILIGGGLLMKAIKTLSRESLKPERTMHTLHELRGSEAPAAQKAAPEAPAPSSAQVQAQVEATETRMGETLDELGRRLSPQHINAQVQRRIRTYPYRSGLIAMCAGLVSAMALKRKYRHA